MAGAKSFMCISLLTIFLVGCVKPSGPVASDQSFRVTSVSVQVFKKGDRPVPLLLSDFEQSRLSTINDFGLNQNRVLADFKRVMADSLIPASRQGARQIHAELVLYALRLRSKAGTDTYLVGWLDFYDAISGVRLASPNVVISQMAGMKPRELRKLWQTDGNVVQEYEALMDLTRNTLPKYLPQP